MSRTTKTLLGLAVAGIVIGLVFASNLVDAHGAVACYVILPVGAIFLGLFLISLMLEKESACYDAEQQDLRKAALRAESNSVATPLPAPPKARESLATANAH